MNINKKLLCLMLPSGLIWACVDLIESSVGIVLYGALILDVARNPALRGQLFSYEIQGFSLYEATGLFAIMMAFVRRLIWD